MQRERALRSCKQTPAQTRLLVLAGHHLRGGSFERRISMASVQEVSVAELAEVNGGLGPIGVICGGPLLYVIWKMVMSLPKTA
jgi:lactobin A/cerein 7B family class IIb bacteriocin